MLPHLVTCMCKLLLFHKSVSHDDIVISKVNRTLPQEICLSLMLNIQQIEWCCDANKNAESYINVERL